MPPTRVSPVIAGPKVLVVEDDPAVAELLQYTLEQAGFATTLAASAESALIAVRGAVPMLALVDWMLPGMSGVALVQRLRQDPRTGALPVLMVTALGEEVNRLAGLDQGADDYITKPFSPRELVARARALLRRRAPENSDAVLCVGPLRLDPVNHSVTRSGEPIALRLIEFRMLRLLMAYPNRVFGRTQFLDRIWGDHVFIEDRTVDVHVRRLRIALGAVGRKMITTVRGGGYKLCAPPPGDSSADPESASTQLA